MISEAELAQMKETIRLMGHENLQTGVPRLLREVEELRAALREIVRSSENLTAPIKFELFAAIGKARAALGSANE